MNHVEKGVTYQRLANLPLYSDPIQNVNLSCSVTLTQPTNQMTTSQIRWSAGPTKKLKHCPDELVIPSMTAGAHLGDGRLHHFYRHRRGSRNADELLDALN